MNPLLFPVILTSLDVAPASDQSEPRTIVLQDLIVSAKCEVEDKEGLVAQIEERLLALPLDALGYRYRSRSDIDYSAKWNPVPEGAPPGSGEELSNNAILAHLQKLRVKKLIVLDVSCHGESGNKAVLTGRMIDLDAELHRLSCPKEDQRELDGKLMCISSTAETSTRLARTKLTHWSAFPSTVSSMFSQLFQIPLVTPSEAEITALIGTKIRIPLTIQWNKSNAQWHKTTLETKVLDLPEERAKQACEAPGEFWESMQELADEDAAQKDLALAKRDVISVPIPDSATRSRVELPVKLYRSVYLLRMRLVNKKGDLPIASLPAYVCVTATAPQWMIGYELTLGKPWDTGYVAGVGPPYTNPQMQFGLRLLFLRQILGSRTRFFPLLRVGFGIGMTYLSGNYPCIDPRATDCGRPASGEYDAVFRASTTVSGDLSVITQGDIVRFKTFGLTLVSSIGVGVGRVRSIPTLEIDGRYALFRGGGGLLVTGLGLLPRRHAAVFWGGVLVDYRSRLSNDFEIHGSLVYRPGVADSLAVLASIGGLFSLRSM